MASDERTDPEAESKAEALVSKRALIWRSHRGFARGGNILRSGVKTSFCEKVYLVQ